VGALGRKVSDEFTVRLYRNRRIARHCTGPVTAEGKELSCRNAVRHGLTAEDRLL
jgi:hypothetical protein